MTAPQIQVIIPLHLTRDKQRISHARVAFCSEFTFRITSRKFLDVLRLENLEQHVSFCATDTHLYKDEIRWENNLRAGQYYDDLIALNNISLIIFRLYLWHCDCGHNIMVDKIIVQYYDAYRDCLIKQYETYCTLI